MSAKSISKKDAEAVFWQASRAVLNLRSAKDTHDRRGMKRISMLEELSAIIRFMNTDQLRYLLLALKPDLSGRLDE